MSGIRFIHGADLHLDCPFKGLRDLPESIFKIIEESTFRAFENLIDAAINNKVDFVLLVGDLYETENRSLRAQFKLRDGLKRLDEHGIQAYIVHGNHDPLSGEYASLDWPANVHFFSEGEVSCIPYEKAGEVLAHIYGFSYGARAEYERKIRQYVRKPGAKFHIGMLHGSYEGETAHATYAPFTLQEMKDCEMDYFALGHIHKREVLSQQPMIAYSGNTQGRSRKESGEKGCYLVEVTDAGVHMDFIPVSHLLWENFEMTITDLESLDAFIQQIEDVKDTYRSLGVSVLLVLHLVGIKPSWWSGNVDDLLEIMDICNEREDKGRTFVYITEIKDGSRGQNISKEKLLRDPFFKELSNVATNPEVFEKVKTDLWKNRKLRKYVDDESMDVEQVQKEAFDWLMNELLK